MITAPVLEYKPLYTRLTDSFRIAVVEKAGYGFSEGNTGASRDVRTMVEESRAALQQSGVQPPYLLAAHSYSGMEAVYWAAAFPEEVEAVLGLDMATPPLALAQAAELPEEKKIAMLDKQQGMFEKLKKSKLLQKLFCKMTLDATGLWSSGLLDAAEREQYRTLFYQNFCNREMRDEQIASTENARLVQDADLRGIPGLLLISEMQSPMKRTTWYAENAAFAKKQGWRTEKISSHYAYIAEAERIAGIWKAFAQSLPVKG